ncbi:MAG: deoxynucleoside kinase [Anaerolineales bacterium]|nr:deoxynucleoside kinase [Anaerolineales bacterium]
MGRLITIVGNNASGKTTLTNALCRQTGFTPWLESHEDRPYQPLFSQDVRRYALPNQIDYLLRRAEQEREIRQGEITGVQDGGLDQDYHLYTRLFQYKGFLDGREFTLCQRTYRALRAGLPAPDLIVWLRAPLDLLRARLQARNRKIDLEQIVTLDDLPLLEGYLEDWLAEIPAPRLLVVDAGAQDDLLSPLLTALSERNLLTEQ